MTTTVTSQLRSSVQVSAVSVTYSNLEWPCVLYHQQAPMCHHMNSGHDVNGIVKDGRISYYHCGHGENQREYQSSENQKGELEGGRGGGEVERG